MRSVLILVMALSCTACSLFLSRPPEPASWQQPADGELPCTTSKLAPGLDVSAAILGGILAGTITIEELSRECDDPYGCESNTFGGIVASGGLLMMLGYGLSAWRGFSVVNDCRAFREAVGPDKPESTVRASLVEVEPASASPALR